MAWVETTNQAPFNIWYSQLLLDGRVLCFEAAVVSGAATSRRCCTLTPDINGSYANGTWATVASMHGTRYVFTTYVLNDGKVFVTGGEYNSDGYNAGEIYDPILNTWTQIAVVPSTGIVGLANGPAAMLPDGKIIIGSADSGQQTHYIFSHVSDTWARAADGLLGPPSDNSYVLTPDNKIFGYSVFSHANQCATYDPLTDSWALRTTNPNTLATGDNMGPTPLLYDGTFIMVGANAHASRYSYATDTWTTLTTGSSGQAASNAPAVTLPNGNALFALGTLSGNYTTNSTYWEFDPGTNVFTRMFSGSEPITAARGTDIGMLMLPTGQVLWTWSANPTGFNNQRVFVYNSTNPVVGNDSWRPAIVSPPSVLARNATTTLTVTQMNGLTIGVSFGNDLNSWTNHPIARLTDTSNNRVYYCRTGNLSTRSIAPGTVGSCTLFVPSTVPLGTYNLEVIANGIPSLAVSVDIVSGAGSQLTADYQYEFAGYLSGAGTTTMMEKVDGIMSPPDTITHHDDGGVSKHGLNYGYENFDARRIQFDFAIDGANGAAAESTYSQFAGAYMMSSAYRSAITVPVAGQNPDQPFVCRRPGKSARAAYAHLTRREVSSTGSLAMGLFRGSVELLCGDPRFYSLASHTLTSNIPGSAVPVVRGHAVKVASFPGAITFVPGDFNVAPQPGDTLMLQVYSFWDNKTGAPMAVPSGWTRYGTTAAAGPGQNVDVFYRSASGWTTTTFGSGLGTSSIAQGHMVAITSGTIDIGQAFIGSLGAATYSMPSLTASGGTDLYVYTFWGGAASAPTMTLPAGATLQTSATQGTTRISKQASEALSAAGATGVRTVTVGGTGSLAVTGATGVLFFGQSSLSTPPVIVNNAGNFPSPRFTITFQGPATNPTITNTTVGRAIRLNAVLSASDIVTIDVANKKIYLNGVSNYGLRRADNQWFDLLPGNNTLVFSRNVSNGVNCPVSITWQDAWESMA